MQYEVQGWGVGELWLDDGRVVNHELPRAREPVRPARHPVVEGVLAYFAG